jgi:hypothetical protein
MRTETLYLVQHVTKLLDWTSKESCFDSRKGKEIYLFSKSSRVALGSTQPPVQWIPAPLFPGAQQRKRGAYHSPLHVKVEVLPVHAMKAYEGKEINLNPFLNSALDRD